MARSRPKLTVVVEDGGPMSKEEFGGWLDTYLRVVIQQAQEAQTRGP